MGDGEGAVLRTARLRLRRWWDVEPETFRLMAPAVVE
jgi:hypothetical protein